MSAKKLLPFLNGNTKFAAEFAKRQSAQSSLVSESAPSVEEASDSTSFNKCVAFDLEANTKYEIECLDDITDEDYTMRWHSQSELKAIKEDIVNLCRRIRHKEVDPLVDEDCTLRGLEDRYCKKRREDYKARRTAAEESVIEHQERFFLG